MKCVSYFFSPVYFGGCPSADVLIDSSPGSGLCISKNPLFFWGPLVGCMSGSCKCRCHVCSCNVSIVFVSLRYLRAVFVASAIAAPLTYPGAAVAAATATATEDALTPKITSASLHMMCSPPVRSA